MTGRVLHHRIDQRLADVVDPVERPAFGVTAEQAGVMELGAVARDQAQVSPDCFGQVPDRHRRIQLVQRQGDAEPVRITQCLGALGGKADVFRPALDPQTIGLIAWSCNSPEATLSNHTFLR